MSRPSKGARLYVKRQKGRQAVYVIRDGAKEVSTGCALEDADGATQALRDYLASHYRPDTGTRSLANVACADVLMLYLTDLPADSPSRETIRYHCKALSVYWGDKSLADVRGSTCRKYVEFRTQNGRSQFPQMKCAEKPAQTRCVSTSTARQELKTLQAAINHWHRESPLEAVPKVSLPKAESRRERWLTRDEVAALLRACRRLSREGHRAAKGAVQFTDYSHVQRFILIGVYTGTRHDRLIRIRWTPTKDNGHYDAGRGVLHRRGSHERETTKRSPAVSVPARLQSHLGRWADLDGAVGRGWIVSYNGTRVLKMRRAWNTVREAAGLREDVTPHTLRHTAASWLLWGREAKGARPAQKPLTIWETAEVLGADASTVEKVYGHHRKPE
jgi:integrase